ncbi:MAG TPA: TIGR03618 family F420-dependent PPOX class oxidoreductase [Streptosporangiaceae bacterium]|nr:TIGR03618 family F420-dependent PPOX class oxidoreductase [Streptosporangiaceae bacterium]
MKQRDRVMMTDGEVESFLARGRKLQLATIGTDGMPHLVTMYYAVLGGQISFWTYRTSQKALNLARDPRVSVLVETGDGYFDLRGVQVQGTAALIEDPAAVLEIGRAVAGAMAGMPEQQTEEYVAHAARKRVGFAVEPTRVISWDHAKLLAG